MSIKINRSFWERGIIYDLNNCKDILETKEVPEIKGTRTKRIPN